MLQTTQVVAFNKNIIAPLNYHKEAAKKNYNSNIFNIFESEPAQDDRSEKSGASRQVYGAKKKNVDEEQYKGYGIIRL
jgi:hypothetical protein